MGQYNCFSPLYFEVDMELSDIVPVIVGAVVGAIATVLFVKAKRKSD